MQAMQAALIAKVQAMHGARGIQAQPEQDLTPAQMWPQFAGEIPATWTQPKEQPQEHAEPKAKDWQVYYYHCDHLGTPRELTDETGALRWSATYKTWGNLLKSATGPNVQQNLRFQGQYFDEETGLHYNRFRYYDPDVGRFVGQDPIRILGGTNNYLYASNPSMWVDPLGLAPCFWNKIKNFKGNKVYQRDDIFDPNAVINGETNLQRMARGVAPIGLDGNSIELHHMLQSQDGPIAEMTNTFHKQNSSIIHINPKTIPSGIDRPQFNSWKRKYWIDRAKDIKSKGC
jgi:RHS repeat-associated protein